MNEELHKEEISFVFSDDNLQPFLLSYTVISADWPHEIKTFAWEGLQATPSTSISHQIIFNGATY